MKRKLISLLMAAAMTFMLAAVVPSDNGFVITSQAVSGVTSYSSENPYPKYNSDGVTRSCTSVAWECIYKNTGVKLPWISGAQGNGGGWYDGYGKLGYKTYTTTPSVGDLACFASTVGSTGHIAYIIGVNTSNNTMTLYEGGYHWIDNKGNHHYGNVGNGINSGASYSYVVGSTISGGKSKLKGFISYTKGDATPTGHIMTESEAAGRTIPNGDYFIVSGLARNYFLDVAGDGKASADNTNITMKISDDGTLPNGCDVFTFEYLNNGFYKIYQKDTKMCLDAYGGTTNSGVNVALYEDNGTNAQQWSVEYTSYGYKLRSRCSSFYVDVKSAAVANGTNVWIWAGNDTAAQKFGFIPYTDKPVLADGTYRIQYDYNKDYYLGAAGSTDSHTSGDGLQIFSNKAEEFVFEYVGGGCYSIKEKNSSLALDLNNGTAENYLKDFTSIALYEYHGGRNQLWYVSKSASGTYFIYNKMGGFLLDVKGGQPSEGCEVAQYHYNGSGSQQWNLIRTELAGDANEDGTVSVKDVTLLSQYLAKWNVKLNKTNANVNADFRLTVADVTMIKQYLANWNVTLKTGMVIDEIEGVVVTIDV